MLRILLILFVAKAIMTAERNKSTAEGADKSDSVDRLSLNEALKRWPVNKNLRINQSNLSKFSFSQYGFNVRPGYINKIAKESLTKVFSELADKNLVRGELTEFKGCYSPRYVSGTKVLSAHAFGLACDFNDTKFSEEFVMVWKRNGWCWGGDFRNVDYMHFSYRAGWDCAKQKRSG